MALVDEVGVLGAHALGKVDGLLQRLVRGVGSIAQGVGHERAHALKFVPFGVGHTAHVGDVGQRTNAVAHDGQLPMQHTNGRDLHAAYGKGLQTLQWAHCELGSSWVGLLSKTIVHVLQDGRSYAGLTVDIDGLKDGEGAQIVQTAYMVEVLVCEQHRINEREGIVVGHSTRQPQGLCLLQGKFVHVPMAIREGGALLWAMGGKKTLHLEAKVGATIQQYQSALVGVEQGRAARAVVAWIGRLAHFALAAQMRHSRRSACAKEVEFHKIGFRAKVRINLRLPKCGTERKCSSRRFLGESACPSCPDGKKTPFKGVECAFSGFECTFDDAECTFGAFE